MMAQTREDPPPGHAGERTSPAPPPHAERLARRLTTWEALLRHHEMGLRARRDTLEAQLRAAGVDAARILEASQAHPSPGGRPRPSRMGRTV